MYKNIFVRELSLTQEKNLYEGKGICIRANRILWVGQKKNPDL